MTRHVAFLVTALALATAAHAQEQRPPSPQISDEVRAELRRLLAEADAHLDAGRHALAFQGYMTLHAEMERLGMPRAAVALWNAGRALAQVPGREREARATLQRFLDGTTALAGEADVAEFRSAAVARIAELDARIGSSDDVPETHTDSARTLTPTGTTIHPVGPVGIAVGVVTLGVGAVFGALALNADNVLWERCGGTACLDTPENHALYDEARLFATVTDVLFVVGGLITIAGTIFAFTLTEGGAEEPERASAVLRLGVDNVAIAGRF